MKHLITILAMLLVVFSCNRPKETSNKGDEIVDTANTSLAEKVSQEKIDCEITLSSALAKKGLKTGDYFVGQDTSGGVNNVLRLYLVFDKDYEDTVIAKLYTKDGLESGRIKVGVNGVSGDVKYFDFAFDKRTHIETKNKIKIE